MTVIVNSQSSEVKEINANVPEAIYSVLPTFCVFIKDLPRNITRISKTNQCNLRYLQKNQDNLSLVADFSPDLAQTAQWGKTETLYLKIFTLKGEINIFSKIINSY